MKHHVFAAAALALGLAVASLAVAQPAGGNGAIRQACMADFQKFCPDARPGPGGAIRDCIKAHLTDFSSGCQSAIATRRAQMQSNAATNSTAPPH